MESRIADIDVAHALNPLCGLLARFRERTRNESIALSEALLPIYDFFP